MNNIAQRRRISPANGHSEGENNHEHSEQEYFRYHHAILRRKSAYRHDLHHHVHSSRWFKSEVETWMQQRIAQSRT